MSIVPTHEQLTGFLALPDDGPVVMLNLLKFKGGGGSEAPWTPSQDCDGGGNSFLESLRGGS